MSWITFQRFCYTWTKYLRTIQCLLFSQNTHMWPPLSSPWGKTRGCHRARTTAINFSWLWVFARWCQAPLKHVELNVPCEISKHSKSQGAENSCFSTSLLWIPLVGGCTQLEHRVLEQVSDEEVMLQMDTLLETLLRAGNSPGLYVS